MRHWIPFLALAICAGCTRPASPPEGTPPLTVQVSQSGPEQPCLVRVGGREVSDAELLALARQARRGTREAIVRAPLNTPYRCVGGAIATLQRAHLRVGLQAEDAAN